MAESGFNSSLPAVDQEDEAVADFLRFGDSISLYDKERGGFMFSHLTGTPYASLAVKEGDRFDPNIGNFKECCFKVMAHNKYKATRDLQKAVKKIQAKDSSISLERAILTGGDELLNLKRMADAEAADNELEQKRRHGDVVIYGQMVQLFHGHTRQYIKVSSTTTSRREASNMKVEMDTNNSKHSWFRIMPRYKVKAEGDYVRMSDQVVLESVKTPGQFLHAARDPNPVAPDKDCYEINLSVDGASFTITPHHQPQKDVDESTLLKAGDVIQLFHKEITAYLAAEGVYTEPFPREDVHMRIRLPDPRRPSRLFPPTSAVSFWQIEQEGNPTKGSLIAWGSQIRLKHVTTQMYLTMEPREGRLTVTNITNDMQRVNSVFVLHAVIREQSNVEYGTYARIEHSLSGRWLHAAEDKSFKRTPVKGAGPDNDLARRVESIPWDGAQLVEIQTTQERMFDDAFIITEVHQDLVYQVNYMAGTLPILQRYPELRAQGEIEPLEAQWLVQTLTEMRKFMYNDNQAIKTRQKLIRNLGVVEVMIEMLAAPLLPDNPNGIHLKDIHRSQNRFTKRVLDAVYGVLEAYLDGDCRKNELYIAKHIPFFQTQIGGFVNVEKMYTELVRDNPHVVKAIGDNEILDFIELLKIDKNPDYLDFLSVLCECNDVAIHGNQEKITRALLENDAGCLVYLTELIPEQGDVVVSVTGRTDDFQSLRKFSASAMDEDDRTSTKEYLFLQKQLDLFGKLCLGRNEKAIHVITEKLHYLTWEECFHCIQDEGLPKSLRSKYVALIEHLFVDVGDNIDILEEVDLLYNWDSLTDDPYKEAETDNTKSLSGAVLTFFPNLAAWILAFMKKNPDMNASNQANNKLLIEVLHLLLSLVKFGYYAAEQDIQDLMVPLASMIDGTNDVPFDASTSKVTFSDAPRTKDNSFLKEWRATGRYQKSGDNALVVEAKAGALEVIDALFNFTFTVRMQHFLFDFKNALEFTGDRRQTRSKGQPIRVGEPVLLPHQMRALREMTQHMEHDGILDHTETIREYLEELYSRSNWITPNWEPVGPKSKQMKGSLVEVLLDLAKYMYPSTLGSSLNLLNRFYSAQESLFELTDQAMVLSVPQSKKLSDYVKHNLPTLRRLGAGYIEKSEISHFNPVLQNLITACELDGPTVPHNINQRIIFNSGITSVIFDVVDFEGQEPEILSQCFKFLKALAVKHAAVQQQLFDRIELFLSIEAASSGYENDLSAMLAEIFTNNQKLCLAVRGSQVEKMMNMLAEQGVEVPQLLIALQAVAKVEELNIPLKRNQALIIKYLMQFRASVIEPAYIDDASDPDINAQRMNLLRSTESSKQKLKEYHMNLVALLASCAEGENRFIESMCQTVFTLDELLEVLMDSSIDVKSKSAYTRFFLWVYLNTAGSPIEVGTHNLSTDERLWNSLKLMAEDEIACYGLNGAMTIEQKEFAFNAFLPFVRTVVSGGFYEPKKFKASKNALNQIGGILGDFATRALPRLTNRDHIKALSSTMMGLSSAEQSSVPQSVLQSLATKLTSGEAGLLLSPAEKSYLNTYGQEIERNDQLNFFVKNVREGYRGKNTVGFQLSQYRTVSSEVFGKKYSEEEWEDEHLPLGLEFQQFVSLFVKPSHERVEVNDHLTALVRQLRESHTYRETLDAKGKEESDQLDQRILQIIRTIVYNEEILGHDYKPIQDEVAKSKAVLPIADMIHNPNDEVVREALACLVALLRDGNQLAQDSFIEHFLGTREESFFDDVQIRVRRSLNSMRETRVLIRQTMEEQQKQKALMGTLTMAGALGVEINEALDAAVEDNQGDNGMEMSAITAKKEDEEIDFGTTDEGNIELVLRTLQLMCEGHNDVLQNYLRTQPDNIRSIDLVAETVSFLQVMIEDINGDNIELLLQTLDTLIEFEQGCALNQAVIFDNRAIDYVNYLLRLPEWKDCEPEEVAEVKNACAVLVLSMLEDSDEDTARMAKELEETLDIPAVFLAMNEFYQLAHVSNQGSDPNGSIHSSDSGASTKSDDDEDDDEDEDIEPIEVAYAFFNIIARLNDFNPEADFAHDPQYNPLLIQPKEPSGELQESTGSATEMQQAESKEEADIMEAHGKSVQKKRGPQKTAYDMLAKKSLAIEVLRNDRIQKIHFMDKWSEHLRREVKDNLLWSVDRSSPSDKIRDFVERCHAIIADVEYLKRVKRLSPITKFLVNHKLMFNKMLLFVTFLINLFILISWDAPDNWEDPLPIFKNSWFEPTLLIAGAIHVVLSVFVTTAYFLVHPPSIAGLFEAIPFGEYVSRYIPQDDSGRTLTSPFSIELIYHILVVVFSVLGLMFDGYFFAFHLLHVVVDNDILLRVIQSVTKNGISLLWVAFLMVIVIYIYSLAAFAFLRKSFDEGDGAFCEDAWQCFLSSLKLGLLSGGGLGEALPPASFGFDEVGIRIIFDLSFFIIITTIGLNVVFGIIVDTFSELRDEKYQIQEAMKGECFICSLPNYEFERHGNGFQHHVKKEHCMWHYLFYLMHLEEKDPNDYTSNEQYIHQSFEAQQETGVFPINRAIALQASQKSGIEDRIGSMEEILRKLVDRFDREDERRQEESRRRAQLEWTRQQTKISSET